MEIDDRIGKLEENLKKLYSEKGKNLLFHGWHHVNFVRKKAIEFANELGVDKNIIEVAALTHDLNFIAKKNSSVEEGDKLRTEILKEVGFSGEEISNINKIILDADMEKRHEDVSNESKILSDADTVFKALPIAPIVFASKYIAENNVDIGKLANKIVIGWKKPLDEDYYFYTDVAKKKYLEWAKIQYKLWEKIESSLQDEDVVELLKLAKELD